MAVTGAVAAVASAGAAVYSATKKPPSPPGGGGVGDPSVADPFAGQRAYFQDYLKQNFPALVGFDPSRIRDNPEYQFLSEEGTRGVNNEASSQGLLHSGNRLLELAKFSSGLASSQIDKDFSRRMQIFGALGPLTGATTGNPGAAGMAGFNYAQLAQNQQNTSMNSLLGGLARFGNINWGSNQPYQNWQPQYDPTAESGMG